MPCTEGRTLFRGWDGFEESEVEDGPAGKTSQMFGHEGEQVREGKEEIRRLWSVIIPRLKHYQVALTVSIACSRTQPRQRMQT